MNSRAELRVAVLVSGSGTNLQAIIDQLASQALPVKIIAVISDRPNAYGLERARAAGIEALAIDYQTYARREDYDAELEASLQKLAPDLVVLAGYMRILADSTVNNFQGRMLNIHPSLLPAYPGLRTYERALAAGEEWHGTTVHFVIPKLDAGPPILQYRVRIKANETEPELRERVQQGEYIIYPRVIGWIAEGRLTLSGDQVVIDGKAISEPLTQDE
jgi:phosphoribosylglycinamide formyltransferase-1